MVLNNKKIIKRKKINNIFKRVIKKVFKHPNKVSVVIFKEGVHKYGT